MFQALDNKVRGLSGDLTQREDTIAKLNKERKALEELQQVKDITSFIKHFFIFKQKLIAKKKTD